MGRQLAMQHRSAGGLGASYDGARYTRTNHDWLTGHVSGDSALAQAWDVMTSRARDLVRNEPMAACAIERIVDNVIGEEGIQSESTIEFDDGTLDDETSGQIDQGFRHWAENEADAEGKMSWAEMQALAVGEMAEVGESFLVAVQKPGRNRSVPLAYQVLEAEQLYYYLDRPRGQGQNMVKRGIEFDSFGEPVAYHFWVHHPYDLVQTTTETVVVPASRVIHLFERGGKPKRPSQTRGITWFAPILQVMRDMGCYVGDEISAARIAQLFVVAIKRAAAAGQGLGFVDEDQDSAQDLDGNPLTDLGSGIVADLSTGEDVSIIQSNRPNSASEPFIRMLLDVMANGMGMTYLGLTGDVRGANYSSARFARLHDKTLWRTIQKRVGRKCVRAVRENVVRQLIAFGRVPSLSAKQFVANPGRWLACDLLPPGWEEVDAAKEVAAAIERIKAGMSTLREECANRGRNWRKVLIQRAREKTFAGSLGLTLSVDQLDQPALVPTPTPQTVDKDDEEAPR